MGRSQPAVCRSGVYIMLLELVESCQLSNESMRHMSQGEKGKERRLTRNRRSGRRTIRVSMRPHLHIKVIWWRLYPKPTRWLMRRHHAQQSKSPRHIWRLLHIMLSLSLFKHASKNLWLFCIV